MASFSPVELATIRNLTQGRPSRIVKADEVIFSPGERGSTLFCVVAGSVRLSWDEGRQWETFAAGGCFGIGALVDPEHRRFGSAVAETDGELLEMNREEFLFAVEELPMFCLEMLQDLEQRLGNLKERSQVPAPADSAP